MRTHEYTLKVIEQSESRLQCIIRFPPNSVAFDGHFKDFSLLPGFYQALTALNLAKKYCHSEIKFSGIKFVKFRQPIFPDGDIDLKIHLNKEKNSLAFEYHHETNYYSKGQIKISHEL